MRRRPDNLSRGWGSGLAPMRQPCGAAFGLRIGVGVKSCGQLILPPREVIHRYV